MTDKSLDITPSLSPDRILLKVTDNGDGTYSLPAVTGLLIPPHDYISLGYTGVNLTSVVYKQGGSGGTTVATLTLAYTGSDLISVTKT